MSVKRGLGRGLDAMLGEPAVRTRPAGDQAVTARRTADADADAARSPKRDGLLQLRVDALRPSPQQPRTSFDAAALAELEASVRRLGVLVPIIVRPTREVGTYEIVAGERRWRAAAAARLETIPALVRDVDDRTSLEFAVVENLQRRDLDPLEEAMGYANLLEEFDLTQDALAERLGKSRPAIANALRLLVLSDAIKARLRAGELSAGHARALLGVPGDEREALAGRIVTEGLSVRAIESRTTERRAPRPSRPPPGAASQPAAAARDADLGAAESRLRYRLGAPVAIRHGSRGGTIEIRFADREDLVRLVDVLLAEG